jgi:hypothetical protein
VYANDVIRLAEENENFRQAPEHPGGTAHRTKEEADEYEREHHH